MKCDRLPTHYHMFLYIKGEMRDKEKKIERNKRDKRNKNRNPTISTSNRNNF
jgi:hypothetical protein